MKSFLLPLASCLFAVSLSAATLVPSSYSYLNAPGDPIGETLYTDAGLTKLTDGVLGTNAWGSFEEVNVGPYAGWDYTTLSHQATITFNFAEPVTIDSVTLWAADSDGAAGVYLPEYTILVGPGDVFIAQFWHGNPIGAGNIVPLPMSGFSYTGTSITFGIPVPAYAEWLMLTEVTFTGTAVSAVPEPSTYAALAGVAVLGVVALRRRNRA